MTVAMTVATASSTLRRRRRFKVPHGEFEETPLHLDRADVRYWTPDEDVLILEMVAVYGRKWHAISSHLPRRTDSGVRNRFLRIMHGLDKVTTVPESCYKCRQCGQLKRGHTCNVRPAAGIQMPQVSQCDTTLDVFWQEAQQLLGVGVGDDGSGVSYVTPQTAQALQGTHQSELSEQ